MTGIRIERAAVAANRLGECPLWCERTGRVWWVDVLAPALWSLDPATGAARTHPVPGRRLGSIALRRSGGLLLAADDGLYVGDPETGDWAFVCDPEPGMADHRKNDGRADAAGRFWVGTLNERDYRPAGAIYRVGPGGESARMVDGLSIPNAVAFSPDSRTLYYADTRAYCIWACDFDVDSGAIADRRVFATTTPPARPDGSCVDAEGHVWNAEYAGGRLVRYDPAGRIAQVVELPVSHPTCCCFGGADLGTLYVTSARFPLTEDELSQEPLAGSLLAFRPGPAGRPEWRVGL